MNYMKDFSAKILTNGILLIYYVQLTQTSKRKQIRKAHFLALI